ncbi:MAG: hypothetical protein UHK60_06970 [Acutalibacteraceae bacterium]|nr:hypothetical protein [Acutalibacteraceae bacterium]
MRVLLDALSGCNEKQVKKINNIVCTMYNRLSQAEEQNKSKPPVKSRAIKGLNADFITLIKDNYFNYTVALEFVLNTKTFEPENTYVLATLNQELKSLIGNGADSRTSPKTTLSNYGNLIVEGNVIKFECLLKPDSDSYYVSVTGSVI